MILINCTIVISYQSVNRITVVAILFLDTAKLIQYFCPANKTRTNCMQYAYFAELFVSFGAAGGIMR